MKTPSYTSQMDLSKLDPKQYGNFVYTYEGNHFQLNDTSILVSSYCDGQYSAREIIDKICSLFPADDNKVIEQDVIKCLTELLDRRLIEENKQISVDWKAPLLITGSPRSGTSALARHLSLHKDFCIFNEYDLYGHGNNTNTLWNKISGMGENNQPPKKVSNSISALKAELFQEFPVPVSNVFIRDWLYETVQLKGLVYGDKMPSKYLFNMRKIVETNPEVKFLVTLRDGRAVIASQIRHYLKAQKHSTKIQGWMKATVAEAEQMWLSTANTWLGLKSDLPAPCLEVRYEQAVQDPEMLAKRICEFVGLTYSAKDFEGFFNKYNPVHVDAWREEFPDMNKQLSIEFLETLSQLGYE